MTKENKFVTVQMPKELVDEVDKAIELYNSDCFNKNKISKSSLLRDSFIDFVKSNKTLTPAVL